MTTSIPSPEIQLAQLLRRRLDFFESRISALEFTTRLQTIDSEFSQQFEALILEMQALDTTQQPTT